ncbi:MAG: 2-hydroxyglutaryl-CoA dehydratase [Ruminococcaceae bacterium]|nr:2-hydroxyglutaryl-CoA dehydratase [Oscillospiraceae bacterium]
MDQTYFLGIDIGSTTAKLVLARSRDDGTADVENVIYETYERHFSRVREKILDLLDALPLDGNVALSAAISGSAGLGLSAAIGVPFVQEVFATGEVVKMLAPDTSAVVELGGEDAKIIFFDGVMDERMNGTCAGGTGAFIDQMATLLNLSVGDMDALSLEHTRIYPIASRCGVFAKTDIQPLLNQGANKADVAASIYQAVVNQTIAGLAQGRRIGRDKDGNPQKVLFLGGPLFFCRGLQEQFVETLQLTRGESALFPEWGPYAVARGTALYAAKSLHRVTLDALRAAVRNSLHERAVLDTLPPLFSSEEDYTAFTARHSKAAVPTQDITAYRGRAWLGIDCGSTTTKLVVISEDDALLYQYYASNQGNPVEIIRAELEKIYALCGDRITLCGSAVTGYGEELIKSAFGVDLGIVETIAHFTAAKHFLPEVDFILDIGGQDIKCFRIANGAIDSIMLNEACSSGCGSFLETFAKSMGFTAAEFAQKGRFSTHPVNLGTRCTVFMNSSVKQSQKDGATPEDISAGLCISVVKNAIYKVIRVNSAEELGRHVVVQGGTFYNDCVLRAFERELGNEVIRPQIAGLMGAFGAALYVKSHALPATTLLSAEALSEFTHTSVATVCRRCTNHCRLTVNTFSGGRRFISGNRCERGAGADEADTTLPNLYEYKRNYLYGLQSKPGSRGTVGLPMALGMYELAVLWHTVFTELGFEVMLSSPSRRSTYEKGQFSIPSDTACYPAKIMHGHIEELIARGANTIFYPCLSYNIDEHQSANHYNCPVVAYYSELLQGNMDSLQKTDFFYPYLNIDSEKILARTLARAFREKGTPIPDREIRQAVKAGFAAYHKYMADVREQGRRALDYAAEHGRRVMILAGRPYHIDPEIGHGIDGLASSLGFVVVSEDSVSELAQSPTLHVLNQWTYHARLYRAAMFAAQNPNVELVQLVSFGCGIDAITTDEVREILESRGKFYTQLKIDEITNLGAVKIRLRSLMGALDDRDAEANAQKGEMA